MQNSIAYDVVISIRIGSRKLLAEIDDRKVESRDSVRSPGLFDKLGREIHAGDSSSRELSELMSHFTHSTAYFQNMNILSFLRRVRQAHFPHHGLSPAPKTDGLSW